MGDGFIGRSSTTGLSDRSLKSTVASRHIREISFPSRHTGLTVRIYNVPPIYTAAFLYLQQTSCTVFPVGASFFSSTYHDVYLVVVFCFFFYSFH